MEHGRAVAESRGHRHALRPDPLSTPCLVQQRCLSLSLSLCCCRYYYCLSLSPLSAANTPFRSPYPLTLYALTGTAPLPASPSSLSPSCSLSAFFLSISPPSCIALRLRTIPSISIDTFSLASALPRIALIDSFLAV